MEQLMQHMVKGNLMFFVPTNGVHKHVFGQTIHDFCEPLDKPYMTIFFQFFRHHSFFLSTVSSHVTLSYS